MNDHPDNSHHLPVLRLATQILLAVVVALGVFAGWHLMLEGDTRSMLRPVMLGVCLVVVSIPALVRAYQLMRTPRLWLIALVTAVLGSMLGMGMFILGAQMILTFLPQT